MSAAVKRWMICAGILLLAVTASCTERSNPAETSSDKTSQTTTDSAGSGDQLYAGKTASFSDSWAVKNDCPLNVKINFTDSGPELVKGSDYDEEDVPGLEWTPSCTGMNQQINFDRNPVAKVSGSSPSASDCQATAEESLSDGTALDAVVVSELSAGDMFCEYVESTGHVILMKVTDVSATKPIKVDWEFTAWAGEAKKETAPAQPGDLLYEDETFELSESRATEDGCYPGAVSLSFDGPVVNYGQGQNSGDVVYFPTCLGGPGTLRFGGYTAQVDGTVDMSTCLDAATGSPDSSLDVEVPQLQTGTTYCEFSTEVDTVILLKITAVDAGSVQFSATAWRAPDE